MEIHVLYRQGMSIRAIAKQLHLSGNTVRCLAHIARTPRYSQRTASLLKLDPFKFYLLERIKAEKPDWIPATVLFRELQARGYEGKDVILRNYFRQFKSKTDEPVQRFETPVSKQLQVDFTTIRRKKEAQSVFRDTGI